MRHVNPDRPRAILQQRLSRVAERAAGIDNVIHQQAIAAFHFTDHIHHFGYASARAALVDDRQIHAQARRNRTRAHNATHIGGDNHQFPAGIAFLNVARIQRCREKIIHRNIEKPLNLRRVQIHGQHAVRARRRDKIRDQLRADWRARA